MASERQVLGRWGEMLVAKKAHCKKCKRKGTLKRLPPNFKCADLICDFCGYLAQVKTATVSDIDGPPPRLILGAAWGPQRDRMASGIYFPLFLVLRAGRKAAVYYLPTDLQVPEMFKERTPLSAQAKRAGWQGFLYDLGALPENSLQRVF